MKPQVEYLPDDTIDAALDKELRGLLTTCFKKPEDVIFETQRYFREPYANRWVIRNERGALVAHVGVHEKNVESEDQSFPIAGIAEVCVHPDYRGRGYVREMLSEIHGWIQERGFPFSLLFGDPGVYSSSGYSSVENLVHGNGEEGWEPVAGMVRIMADTAWPTDQVRLPGPKF